MFLIRSMRIHAGFQKKDCCRNDRKNIKIMFAVEETGDDGVLSTPPSIKDETKDESENSGTLIINASCVLPDIPYSIDLEFCERARRWPEIILNYREFCK